MHKLEAVLRRVLFEFFVIQVTVLGVAGVALFLIWLRQPKAAMYDVAYTKIYETVERSVVKLTVPGLYRGGTGFTVQAPSGKSYILTNWHVCLSAMEDGILLASYGREPVSTLKIIISAPHYDLCLLTGIGQPALRLAKSEPQSMQKVHTVGHPGLKAATPSSGQIVGKEDADLIFPTLADGTCPGGLPLKASDSIFGRVMQCVLSMVIVDTTITAAPGASGSPVVNSEGLLVGVINSTNGVASYGSMVPLKNVEEFLTGQ